MTENERVVNLFILFLLMMMKIGYEMYLNGVSLRYLFSYSVFIGPFLFTVCLGLLGEVVVWMGENRNMMTYVEKEE